MPKLRSTYDRGSRGAAREGGRGGSSSPYGWTSKIHTFVELFHPVTKHLKKDGRLFSGRPSIHLQNRKIVCDRLRTLAYDIPRRNLSTLKVITVSRSYDKLKIILLSIVRYFVNRAPASAYSKRVPRTNCALRIKKRAPRISSGIYF